MSRQTHPLTIGSLHRELPLFEVAPGLRIAVLNILGDTELTEYAAEALAERLDGLDPDVLVTAEAKSIPLVHALAVRSGKAAVVLRKSWKPYMGEAISATTRSITTGREQTLYLDEKDRRVVAGRRVALVDDVISTGSTLQAMEQVMSLAGGQVVVRAAICTEGDVEPGGSIIALAHLPLFRDPDGESGPDD